MTTTTAHDDPERQLRAFQVHAGVFAASMLLIVLLNLVINAAAGITGELRAWWSVYALLGWAIGIAVHGLVVWGSRTSHAG